MDRIISLIWFTLLACVVTFLTLDVTRVRFVELTLMYPYIMGMLKIAVLGTMGELLGCKVATGKWKLTGIRIYQRIGIWALLGIAFTAVFPLFSFGVDGLLKKKLIPGLGGSVITAFWKSFFTNILFGFPMMIFHRFTDTLISNGKLFTIWPVVSTFKSIDWENMFRIVGASCIWFWIPAHTITFMLPPEFRVMSAALLAIVLGFILGLAKRKSLKQN